jgi:hypothetical protein
MMMRKRNKRWVKVQERMKRRGSRMLVHKLENEMEPEMG